MMIYIIHDFINTSLPAAGRSLVGGRITNEDVKPYRKVNSLVALKFHPEVLSFDFSCVTKFVLEFSVTSLSIDPFFHGQNYSK